MKRLGRVIAFTRGQRLTVKSCFTPPLGAPVYDEDGAKIGSVFDVFGSVKEPYASIKLDKGVKGEVLVNRDVFVGVKSRVKGRNRDG